MAWTKEQQAANFAEKKKDPVWYAAHKQKARENYHKNKDRCVAYAKEYRAKNLQADRDRSKKYYKENPNRRQAQRNRNSAKRYGLTVEQLLEARKTIACEICQTPFMDTKSKHVDHCHTTGKYRGMLCSRCNLGLGRFRDSIQFLESAANYLRKHK